MSKMRKTLIPRHKKILRSLRIRKIQKKPKIQLANQNKRRKKQSILKTKTNPQTKIHSQKQTVKWGPIAQPGMSAALPISQHMRNGSEGNSQPKSRRPRETLNKQVRVREFESA